MKFEQQDSAVNTQLELSIVEYLQTHPEFFARNEKMLAALRIPHACGDAVSLIERQIAVLRKQNEQLRAKMHDLVRVARDNDCLSQRMQHLNLALIEAQNLDEMLHNIQNVLREEFNADYCTLRLETDGACQPVLPAQNRLHAGAGVLFESSFKLGRARCGRLSTAQVAVLFDEVAAEVASSALIPLGGSDWRGLLGIGSRDGSRFHPGMGVLFLNRIGELISYALQAHLYRVGTASR